MFSLRHVLILSSMSLVAACGFHLKGQGNNTTTLQAIYLECECSDSLATTIVQRLQNRGIQLISTPGTGLDVTIDTPEETAFDTVTGDRDRSKEVELTNAFTVHVSQNGHQLDQQRIQSSAYINYDSDTYLGNSAEATETRTRLWQDNTDKLIRYLESTAARSN